jgi:hypothetical protein
LEREGERERERVGDRERGLNVGRYTPLCVYKRRNHIHAKTKNYIQNTTYVYIHSNHMQTLNTKLHTNKSPTHQNIQTPAAAEKERDTGRLRT